MSEGVLKSFYNSKVWIIFRQQYIIKQMKDKQGIKCSICNKNIIESADMQLHHTPIELTEDNYKDTNISLNEDNIKIACRRCHNKEHGRFCGGAQKRREKAVYIVYGPPLSGKISYVQDNMEPGDLVVDMDRLYSAISLLQMYDKPDNLQYNVFSIRNHIINNIKTRYGGFKTAWIIGGYPERYMRDKLVEDLGAETIFIDVSKEECIERLNMCTDFRSTQKNDWTQYIEHWFENFSK